MSHKQETREKTYHGHIFAWTIVIAALTVILILIELVKHEKEQSNDNTVSQQAPPSRFRKILPLLISSID